MPSPKPIQNKRSHIRSFVILETSVRTVSCFFCRAEKKKMTMRNCCWHDFVFPLAVMKSPLSPVTFPATFGARRGLTRLTVGKLSGLNLIGWCDTTSPPADTKIGSWQKFYRLSDVLLFAPPLFFCEVIVRVLMCVTPSCRNSILFVCHTLDDGVKSLRQFSTRAILEPQRRKRELHRTREEYNRP